MKKTRIVTKTNGIVDVICDVCHKEMPEGKYSHICKMCKKDLCEMCAIAFDIYSDLHEPSYYGDYPSYICKDCWEKGFELRMKIESLRVAIEKEEDELIKEWYKLCSRGNS